MSKPSGISPHEVVNDNNIKTINILNENFTNYKLYLTLKIFFKSHLKTLQGMGFLKKLGRVVQQLMYLQ